MSQPTSKQPAVEAAISAVRRAEDSITKLQERLAEESTSHPYLASLKKAGLQAKALRTLLETHANGSA